MKTNVFILVNFLFILLFSTTSCEKVIDVDLNEDQERVVIEGQILYGDSTHTVKITKTLNFDETIDFPAVTNASVTVVDNLGNAGTFTHVGDGIYELSNYPGVTGRTYTMTIIVDGITYTAKSTMPTTVLMDTLLLSEFVFGIDTADVLTAVRLDPANERNYYKFLLWKNDTLFTSSINLQDDQFADGNLLLQPVEFGSFLSGDTLLLEMANLSKDNYDYYKQLQLNTSGQGATPANPTSNFNNGALGYFSARSVHRKKIIVP